LRQGGEVVGELIVGLRPGEARLDPGDARILDLVSAPIAATVQAVALAEQLRSSREQVITAREEERRRLRRDLHDGLGPVLTGVVLNAEAALRRLSSDPAQTADLLVELRDQATGALEDIRRLVYDLRPPALDSLGLVEALREQAAVLGKREGAAPLQVSVEAPTRLPELPAAVEVAAYRIVTEALTNVVRHSSASAAVVTLTVTAGVLQISVHDDGINLGAGWQAGVGLTSIRERAAELGGRCRIEHDRTGGRVDVELPCGSPRDSRSAPRSVMRCSSRDPADRGGRRPLSRPRRSARPAVGGRGVRAGGHCGDRRRGSEGGGHIASGRTRDGYPDA
jgi:signal transduction histidine kinase